MRLSMGRGKAVCRTHSIEDTNVQKITRNELVKSEISGGCGKASRMSNTTTVVINLTK